MIDGFSARQAVQLTGLPYATLDYWDRTNFLKPSIVAASGKGSDRIYSFPDIVALRVAVDLRRGGLSLQAMRRVGDYLRRRDDLADSLASTYLVTDGTDVFERRGDDLLSVLRRPGQGCFHFVLSL